MDDAFWRRKLMAFLHDPPCKPLDIAGHEKIGEGFITRAGLDLEEKRIFDKECDWTAAAADRFPFPMSSFLTSSFQGTAETPFRHPLGGSSYAFDRAFPSAAAAEGIFQDIQNGITTEGIEEESRAWANFFLHWRRWPVEAARKDSRTAFLPADTRLPDHNTWVHNSVVSALQGCVVEGRLRPAFLLFQMGPVQTFIEQARSTRDLWSGSYLLSWLVAHAIKAVTDRIGPDAVIFPALRGQPIFDLLHRDCLYEKISYASGEGRTETLWQRMRMDIKLVEMLTPNLPNRFLAVVPDGQAAELAAAAEKAVLKELPRIAEASWNWLHARHPLQQEWRKRFDAQVTAFPQITWQVVPWGQEDVAANLKAYEQLFSSDAQRLQAVHDLAVNKIPADHRDKRYFHDQARTRLNNQGFCWPYFYALTDWLLAARRNTRDFRYWNTDEHQGGTLKDSFSGMEEIIGSEDWWDSAKQHSKLKFHFRSDDRLGAMNLVKRVWHQAYLGDVWKVQWNRAVRFESVPGVAAGRWRQDLLQRMHEDASVWQHVLRARELMQRHAAGSGVEIAPSDLELADWIETTDPGCFNYSQWGGQDSTDSDSAVVVVKALNVLYAKNRSGGEVSPPPGYYAVLAFDGDEMGKWISGEKTPPLKGQLSAKAVDYFEKNTSGAIAELQRPLSPSYHLQFSEALGNFGLYLARPIVNHFGGQLIYSGGDDVLAMVPAAEALNCAEALVAAFRGNSRLEQLVPTTFKIEGENGGFVRLLNPEAEQPSWPLLVPGPSAAASVGVAIGHSQTPLQNLIRAAHAAEKHAKNRHGRAACAVALHKRSGEILEWGFKWIPHITAKKPQPPDLYAGEEVESGFRWASGALEVYRLFQELSAGDDPVLSGRFGYALDALVAPYRTHRKEEDAESLGGSLKDAENFPAKEILNREFCHVLSRQARKPRNDGEKEIGLAKKFSGFKDACESYISQIECGGRSCLIDFPMLFHVANFIRRGE